MMAAKEIFGRLKTLPQLQQRKAAAILGAIVSDAATAPLHWIYDQAKVADFSSKAHGRPEFYYTSQCPFYTIETGRTSAYGEQLLVVLKTLAETKEFNATALADALFQHYGPGTEFAAARALTGHPIKGPWTNHCLKIFIAKREEGETPESDSKSPDPDGLVRSLAVVALFSGTPELLDNMKKGVEVIQSNPIAIGYALGGARILDHVIQTGTDGLDTVIQQLKDPNREFKFETDEAVAAAIEKGKGASSKPHQEAVKEFGMACGMPASFHGMIQGIASSKDFTSAVRIGILAAGDNCSRGAFIGACVAARHGLESIPEDWVLKVKDAEHILSNIETLVQL